MPTPCPAVRYPENEPWFNIADLLEPGLRPRFESSCGAQTSGNTVHLAVSLVVESGFTTRVSNTLQMLMTLPPEFRCATFITFAGIADGGPVSIGTDGSGRLGIPTSSPIDPATVGRVDFAVTFWRK